MPSNMNITNSGGVASSKPEKKNSPGEEKRPINLDYTYAGNTEQERVETNENSATTIMKAIGHKDSPDEKNIRSNS